MNLFIQWTLFCIVLSVLVAMLLTEMRQEGRAAKLDAQAAKLDAQAAAQIETSQLQKARAAELDAQAQMLAMEKEKVKRERVKLQTQADKLAVQDLLNKIETEFPFAKKTDLRKNAGKYAGSTKYTKYVCTQLHGIYDSLCTDSRLLTEGALTEEEFQEICATTAYLV